MENKRRSSSTINMKKKSQKEKANDLRKAKSLPKSQSTQRTKSQPQVEDTPTPRSLSNKKLANSRRSDKLLSRASSRKLSPGVDPSIAAEMPVVAEEDPSSPIDSVQHEDLDLDGTHLEFCKEIMHEFKEEALDLCSRRLYDFRASEFICCDLRNAWLRIMEQQWMDVSDVTVSKPMILESVDEGPPSALHFDMWARGTLEVLPDKPESFTSPYIETIEDKQRLTKEYSQSSFVKMDGSGDGLQVELDSPIINAPSAQKFSTLELPNLSTSTRDLQYINSPLASPFATWTTLEDAGKTSQKTMKSKNKKEMLASKEVSEIGSVSTIASINHSPSAKSVSRFHEILTLKGPPASIAASSSSQSSQTKRKLRPWTISQCGGRDGSGGVFRLKNQTTSEAIALLTEEKKHKSALEDSKSASQRSSYLNNRKLRIEALDDDDLDIDLGLGIKPSASIINISGHDSFKEFGEFLSPNDNDTDTLYQNGEIGKLEYETDSTAQSISEIASYVDLKHIPGQNSSAEELVDIHRGSFLNNFPEDVDEEHPHSLMKLPLEDKVGRLSLWGTNNAPRASRVSDKEARLERNTLTKMIQTKQNQMTEFEKSPNEKRLDKTNVQKKAIPSHDSSSKKAETFYKAAKPVHNFVVTSGSIFQSKDKPISERELVDQRVAISQMRISMIKNHRNNLRARISNSDLFMQKE